MGCNEFVFLLCSAWCFFYYVASSNAQLQSSQTQVLLQLKKHLEYPTQLELWKDRWSELCFISSPQVKLTCKDNFVTELTILGDKPNKGVDFDGFVIPNKTLSLTFSMDSFVATLTRLTSLRVLNLVSLGIWGPLPDRIHRLTSLEHLDLSSNYLFGSIPPKISTMVNLQSLRLGDNFFNGSIPSLFNSTSNLTILSLKNNRLKGQIPKEYGQLIKLQQLDISFNELTGTAIDISELFSLPNISYLNLASNMLNGQLQNHMKCGNQLKFVDISNNRLVGELPYSLTEKRVVKSDGNCLSGNLKHQHEVSYCTEEVHGKEKVGILIGFIVGILVMIVLLGLCIVFSCKRYCSRGISEQHLLHKTVQDSYSAGLSSELVTNARYVSEAAKLGKEDIPPCRSYSLEELKEATNNFDSSTFIGENIYGKLYKGKLESGMAVVIRCLPLSKKYSIRNFKLRLDLLAKLRHPHLVSLLGHCIDGIIIGERNDSKVYLIYESVSNGTFHTHLSGDGGGKVFNWSERLSVLISIAKAVHFLHTGMIPGFFKNRLKTNNILLNENWMPKLSDYGLSIISEETDASGVKGENPNSWQMKKLEDDIYSFGFILLEALVGPLISDKREATVLNAMATFNNSQDEWKEMVEPVVQSSSCKESLSIVISITNKCISQESWSRPSIEDVLWNLQYASQVQTTADGDHRT